MSLNKEQLEELRAVIIEKVPSIKEIQDCATCEGSGECYYANGELSTCLTCTGAGDYAAYRQIGLADVLQSFRHKWLYYAINQNGAILVWDAGDIYKPTGYKWFFGKSLEDQSDELKQFLYDILVTKK